MNPYNENIILLNEKEIIEGKADKSLLNLTAEGEAHFANPDLLNLSSEGESHFDDRYLKLSGGTLTGVTYGKASDAVNSLLTTAAITKAQNGYVKLGNGIIIQWGLKSIGTGDTTITFPAAFNNTNYVFVSTPWSSDGSYTSVTVKSRTATTITCYLQQGNYIKSCFWIAIGT